MSSLVMVAMQVIFTLIIYYCAYRLINYLKLIKGRFAYKDMQMKSIYSALAGFGFFAISLILFVLNATEVIKLIGSQVNEKTKTTETVTLSFSAISVSSIVFYLSCVMLAVLISFMIIVIVFVQKSRIQISKKEFDEFDIEKYDINILGSFTRANKYSRNIPVTFKDQVGNMLFFKKFGTKMFLSKIVDQSIFFISQSPYVNKVYEQNEVTFTEDTLLASHFSNNKEYILFVLKSAQKEVSVINKIDEKLFEEIVLKKFA
ncbi:hypothetical protein VBM90_01690 [Mycoplasma sp. 2704]|uniref:hypothetical protein n=1 Tax=unclassified Mycoplasma TaxID=2683645 RepID=UPI002B1D0F76|nr:MULTISPECIES: hypothetical protein [unclassified Mycoplasma]MEA4134514.1 hypothetical protein [Mycoplasma sp. 2704]MEA4333749.1 hypothetical protein [Mycoplasma sp. 1232]